MMLFGGILPYLLVLWQLLASVDVARAQDEPAQESACPAIVKRAAWGAAKSKNVTYQLKPVANVIVHHTTGERCATVATCKEMVANIQTYHQTDNRWSDIGYNFLISGQNVYEGIGWHRMGAHLRGYNDKSIGVAFLGNFDQERPTPRSLNLLARLLQCGVELGELADDYRLYGARQLQSTNSPGRYLYAKLQELDHWQAQ
ncbi:AGAP000536-PA [Anopheles gambiae str. PEST]|uniref:Peptidoglycan-recognition protein n=2 Tax=gambiae species complex TaxID=44542 RepID=Q7QFK2_ANOGA|nr:peptidoglycan-recognition protein 2 [Anopheles gambiae]EAA06262.4 AGAP000536-PA [Anopheles gambiae str. PEST]